MEGKSWTNILTCRNTVHSIYHVRNCLSVEGKATVAVDMDIGRHSKNPTKYTSLFQIGRVDVENLSRILFREEKEYKIRFPNNLLRLGWAPQPMLCCLSPHRAGGKGGPHTLRRGKGDEENARHIIHHQTDSNSPPNPNNAAPRFDSIAPKPCSLPAAGRRHGRPGP